MYLWGNLCERKGNIRPLPLSYINKKIFPKNYLLTATVYKRIKIQAVDWKAWSVCGKLLLETKPVAETMGVK